jgi:glycosyltransferase involved in cell wall biosynthesis
MKKINIVVPCFNEENNLEKLLSKLDKVTTITGFQFNYLFVDDGSADGTFAYLEKISRLRKNIKVLKLSRNFGSHIGISAGIENSQDVDAIILLPADLQEPPELIPELIKKWEEGNEVVWTIRESRSQSLVSKLFSNLFYKIFVNSSNLRNYPKEGPSAFFLLDKKVVREWGKFGENNRMIIGLIAWMGFRQAKVYYKQNKRISGKSSWGFMKLVNCNRFFCVILFCTNPFYQLPGHHYKSYRLPLFPCSCFQQALLRNRSHRLDIHNGHHVISWWYPIDYFRSDWRICMAGCGRIEA